MVKTSMKKTLAGVLATVMTFTSVPVFVQAEADKDAVILYTNDVHCAIDDYSKLAAYAAQLEEDGHDVVIVDAGDAIQGEVIGTLTEGDAIVDLMNTVGYDYAIPGNHEFDYGMEKFREITGEKSQYEYLSSNIVDLRTGKNVLDSYDVVELNGEKIAFIGITTPETLTSTTPAYFQDENGNVIYSFSQDNLYETVQKAVDAAKEEGAERVIALGHLGISGTYEGWKSTDIIANTTGIDVLLDAHSHDYIEKEIYKNKIGEDVIVSSTGEKFDYFGKLTLDEEGVETTEWIVPEEVEVDKSEASKAAYKKVQDKIAGYNEQMAYLFEVIGTTETSLTVEDSNGRIVRKQETNAGDFVTDAYRAVTGADIAVCNGGGIRANLEAGDVTRQSLMNMNPWSNGMCVAKVTGQQILDALEYGAYLYPDFNGAFLQVSGLTYEIHAYKESPVIMNEEKICEGIDNTKERRVQNVKVNGEALKTEDTYTVAASEYIFDSHGDGYYMLRDCEVISEEGIPTDAEMLIHYFTENLNGKITSAQYGNKKGDGRIKIIASEEAIYHNLKVAGISVNSSNAEDILGDGTASYDLETNTLTLENAELYIKKPATGNTYGVRAEGSINIELKGINKIHCEDYYGIAVVAATDGSATNVTISGDGSLESYGSDGGILIRGSLTIGNSVNIASQCGNVTSGSGYGIRVYDDLTICDHAVVVSGTGSAPTDTYAIYAADELVITDQAKVTAKAGEAGVNSYGISSGDNFTASGEAQITTEGGKGTERSAGLYAISNIYVKDNAEVTTAGEVNNEPEKFASESYGIRTTHMYISGGTLTTIGRAATISGLSAGIYTQDFELTGGTVNASSVDAGDALSIGIQSTKTFKIIGGTLNAASGDTTTDSYAIEASSGIDVSGGAVNAVTGKADSAHGIDADMVNVTGGSVNVYNKGAMSQARGIRSNNEITISGGDVRVEVGDAESRVFGIQAGAPVSITGGKVFVYTGKANGGSAIYGWSGITIVDAEVNVTSGGNGIYAPGGSVIIDCTDVTVADNKPMLLGTIINVNAEGYGIYGENGVNVSGNLKMDNPEEGLGNVVVEPLGYYVTVKGIGSDKKVLVPAGKSVNEVYCENLGVDDFADSLDTEKRGYNFKGFYTDESCTEGNEYSFDTAVKEDIVIYAKWVKKSIFDNFPGFNKPETDKPGTDKPDTDKPTLDFSGISVQIQNMIGKVTTVINKIFDMFKFW